MSWTQRIMKLAIGTALAAGPLPAVSQTNDSNPQPSKADAPPVRYQSVDKPVHHIRIDGNSNLVKWHTTGQAISGAVDVPAVWRRQDDQLRLEPDFTAGRPNRAGYASIPVLEIRGEDKGLSARMHETMEASKHRYVTFALTEVKAISALPQPGGVRWAVRGDLTVSGVTREVDLDLDILPQPGDRLQIELQKQLKMTDFQIDPPKALGGFIRAHDEVDIHIRWFLERQSPQPTTTPTALPDSTRQAVSGVVDAYSEIHQALQNLESDEIKPAVQKTRTQLAQLQPGDVEGLEESIEALGQALTQIEKAPGPNGMRQGFAELTRALKSLLALAGHSHDRSIIAYRQPNQEGVAAAEWLQVYDPETELTNPNSEGEPISLPRVVAIYPGKHASEP